MASSGVGVNIRNQETETNERECKGHSGDERENGRGKDWMSRKKKERGRIEPLERGRLRESPWREEDRSP